MLSQRKQLQKRLQLFRAVAHDHPPGESKRLMEQACAELEAQIKELEKTRSTTVSRREK